MIERFSEWVDGIWGLEYLLSTLILSDNNPKFLILPLFTSFVNSLFLASLVVRDLVFQFCYLDFTFVQLIPQQIGQHPNIFWH